MISYLPHIESALVVCTLVAMVLSVASLRLTGVFRWYAFSSLFFAALTAVYAAESGQEELFIVAGLIALVKGILLPYLLHTVKRRSGISGRVGEYMKPTALYFFMLVLLIALSLVVRHIPFATGEGMGNGVMLFGAVSLVFLGLTQMMVHRTVLAQIVGFLAMENGIVLFSVTVVGSISLWLECMIFITVACGAWLMTLLTRQIQASLGSTDTQKLNELID